MAPCLPGGYPAITLKDAQGGIVGVLVDEAFDVRVLPVAEPGKAESRSQAKTFLLPLQLHGGRYDVFLSIGTRTGTPRIALPLDGDDGQRRYRLGTIRVLGDYGVRAGVPQRRGADYYLPLTWSVHGSLPDDVQPFCHLDRGGRIYWYGHPASVVKERSLRLPGNVELGCTFTIPKEAATE